MTEPQLPGTFSGPVCAIWSDDGRNMILTKKLVFIDFDGSRWVAEVGDTVNGASIPRIFWRVIGSPFCGRFRRASVIHDVYCTPPYQRDWPVVHRCFRTMMKVDQVAWWKRVLMFNAVWYFGPRWDPIETMTCN